MVTRLKVALSQGKYCRDWGLKTKPLIPPWPENGTGQFALRQVAWAQFQALFMLLKHEIRNKQDC